MTEEVKRADRSFCCSHGSQVFEDRECLVNAGLRLWGSATLPLLSASRLKSSSCTASLSNSGQSRKVSPIRLPRASSWDKSGYLKFRKSVALTCVCPLNWRQYKSTIVEFRNAVRSLRKIHRDAVTVAVVVVGMVLKADLFQH